MAETRAPFPVKYFIAVLFHEHEAFEKSKASIVERWGAIDYEGADHLFDVTTYYESEMGTPLYRRIVTLETIRSPKEIVDMKLECNAIEAGLVVNGKRAVNLDAGYLDHNKVLLASAKEAGQKVYLDKGIYADLAGRYKDGCYRPFEWSFPDFKDGRYDSELLIIRTSYLKQIKQWRKMQ